MDSEHWRPVPKGHLFGFLAGVAALVVLSRVSEPGFIPLLDHANLLFHEAGHPLVGLFSERLEPYGGTLGQLAFPVALMISLWRKEQLLSFAAAGVWFFQNWWNIARYVADARALELPLVGGGIHDWNNILHRWEILHLDTTIAWWLNLGGWLGVAGLTIWATAMAWQRRRPPQTRDRDLSTL